MKFEFTKYWKPEYCLVTKCGYRVLSITDYSNPRDHHLVCRIANDDGEINEFIYNYDGKMIMQGWSRDMTIWKVSKPDMELIMHKCERKWFNVRLGLSGTLESSRAYDTEEEALKYKLLSDTDTICVITKIYNDGKDEETEEI